MAKRLNPMHPGEVLREEFLIPLKMSAGALARVCGLPRARIERIASEQTGVAADTALRLAKALDTTAQLWLNLQTHYDIKSQSVIWGRFSIASRPSTNGRRLKPAGP